MGFHASQNEGVNEVKIVPVILLCVDYPPSMRRWPIMYIYVCFCNQNTLLTSGLSIGLSFSILALMTFSSSSKVSSSSLTSFLVELSLRL